MKKVHFKVTAKHSFIMFLYSDHIIECSKWILPTAVPYYKKSFAEYINVFADDFEEATSDDHIF